MAMTKAEATQIMKEIEAEARKVFEAHGLKMTSVNAGFAEGEIKVSVKAEAKGESSPRIVDWNRYAESYGLPVDALGKTITYNRSSMTITGLATSKRKFPVCAVNNATGAEMLLTVSGVKKALGLPVNPWD